jgi:hypothetical protein
VAHTCNSGTWEDEADYKFEAILHYTARPFSKNHPHTHKKAAKDRALCIVTATSKVPGTWHSWNMSESVNKSVM